MRRKKRKVVVGSKDIEKWIGQVVAKTHKASGKAICPYAKKTLQDRKVQITMAKKNVLAQIDHCCSLFSIFHLDIVVLYFPYKINEKKLSSVCKKGFENNPDYAMLYDHPDNKGKHKGVSFSYGKAPLLMIQNLNKLKNAQQQLRKSNYYDAWGLDPNDSMFY